MAEHRQQGTGQHAHKSSEEPYPHHEAPTTSDRSGQRSESRSESRDAGSEESRSESQHEFRSDSGRSNNEDLKSREYRDNNGEVHHHTTTYMEQHERKAS